MDAIKYSIVVSPENLKGDLLFLPFSGTYYSEACGIPTEEEKLYDFGLYSAFTKVISGGTNGDSVFTGLTVPVLFTETINDIGYYSDFDGFMLQQNVVTNFLYSGQTSNPYTINLYNTSGNGFLTFLRFSSYKVDWGDNSPITNLTLLTPTATHT